MTDEKPGGYTPVDDGDPSGQHDVHVLPKPGEAPPSYTQPSYTPPVGQAVIIRNGQIQPDDYLGFSICMTVCLVLLCQICAVPCGIIGIIKSTEVRSQFRLGNYKKAEEASQAAKMWTTIAMVTTIITIAIVLFLYVVAYVFVVPR